METFISFKTEPFDLFGVKFSSFTQNITNIVGNNINIPALANAHRLLSKSAKPPPSRGPKIPPEAVAVDIIAKAYPTFLSGVLVPIRAIAHGIKPVSNPCIIRKVSNSYRFVTNAVRMYIKDKNTPARIIIGLRPYLSANIPQ